MPQAQSIPISALDRPWLSAESSVVIGPLNMPSLDDLRAAFVELALLGPRTRAGYTFDSTRSRWLFDPARLTDLAQQVVTSVESPSQPADEAEPVVFAEVERLLNASTLDASMPLKLVRGGNFLIQHQNHAFGDAQALLRLPAALVHVASTGTMPKWVDQELTANPAVVALRNALATGRRPMSNLFRDRPSKGIRQRDDLAGGPLRTWTPQMRVVFQSFSRSSWQEVQQWRRANASQASMASVYLVVLRMALRAAGVTLSPETVVLYDCRRYLPSGAHVRGNFVTARSHQFSDDAVATGNKIAETSNSAEPLGTLVMATAKRMLLPARRRLTTVSDAPVTVPAFVFPPRNGGLEALPWQRDDLHCVGSANTPSGPADITAAMMMIGGRLALSFTYHDNVIAEADLRRAAALMEHEAIALLSKSNT
jgi:hypothetical protein